MYLSPTTHGDRIRRCDAGRFVMYESTYASATALPPHYHEVAALLFSTRGSFAEHVRRRMFECNAFDVIVRPAVLTNGPRTRVYRSGFDAADKSVQTKISRADVADFMLGQLIDDANLRKTPGVSY